MRACLNVDGARAQNESDPIPRKTEHRGLRKYQAGRRCLIALAAAAGKPSKVRSVRFGVSSSGKLSRMLESSSRTNVEASVPVRRVMGPALRRVMGPGRRSEQPRRSLPRIGRDVHWSRSASSARRPTRFSQGHGASRVITVAASSGVAAKAASSPVPSAEDRRPRSSA